MPEGYFIGFGDKTTCGGTVINGDPRVTMFGLQHACEGDYVTCGKHPGTYQILGGISHIKSHDRLMAGTLDSFSSCPCQARFIPSVYTVTYDNEGYEPPVPRRNAEPAPATQARTSAAPHQPTHKPASSWTPSAVNSPLGQEPGFYIVPKSTTREALEATLFPTPEPAVMSKFQALNPRTNQVKAGSLIVLSDPNNFQCTREESKLMAAAAQTDDALSALSAEEADFMERHRKEIQSFLALGSTAMGAGEAMLARNFGDIRNILQEIETLHQSAFLRDGHLRSPEFFSERKRLLAQLDIHLATFVRKGIGLPDHPNLKSALGISSRSLVHHWTQAGAPGQIPGYATHIEGISRAAKAIKYGGWIGMAAGAGASAMKVQNVCSAGNKEACEKVKYTETGNYIGSVAGGAAAGAFFTGSVVSTLCVALGVPTAGAATLACGIVVVGAGSVAGGAIVGSAGEKFGEVIYEKTK